MRLRVSTIDLYRKVLTTDYASEQELIDRCVHGQWAAKESTASQRAGTAWHAILADPLKHARIELNDQGEAVTSYASDDHLFTAEDVWAAQEYVGPGLVEVTAAKTFGPFVVEGTCDRIRGLRIRDAKTSLDDMDPSDYEHSLQWRFYLALHEATEFVYDFFRLRETTPKGQEYPRSFRVRDTSSASFWPYPGMDADLLSWCHAFRSWAARRGVLEYIAQDRRLAQSA